MLELDRIGDHSQLALEVELLFAEARRRARIRRSRLVVILTFATVALLVATAAVVRPANQLPVTCPVVCTEGTELAAVHAITIGYYGLTLTSADGSTVRTVSYRTEPSAVKRTLATVFRTKATTESRAVAGRWGWHGFEIIDQRSWLKNSSFHFSAEVTARSVNGVEISTNRGDRVGDSYPTETSTGTGLQPEPKTVYSITPTCAYGDKSVIFQLAVGLLPGYHAVIIGSDSSTYAAGTREPRVANIDAPIGPFPYCQ